MQPVYAGCFFTLAVPELRYFPPVLSGSRKEKNPEFNAGERNGWKANFHTELTGGISQKSFSVTCTHATIPGSPSAYFG